MKLLTVAAGICVTLVMQGALIAPAQASSSDYAYCSTGYITKKKPVLLEGGTASCSKQAILTKVRVRIWCEHRTPTGGTDHYAVYGPYVTQDGKTGSVAYCEVNDSPLSVMALPG
jgi:hypothetical protein